VRHRLEQRKGSVPRLDGFVGDPEDALGQEHARQRRIGGKVQVGEERLPRPQARVLLGERLLDLQDEVGRAPDFRGGGAQFGARRGVFGVGESGAAARGFLHHDPGAQGHATAADAGGQRHPGLAIFQLLGNADDHGR
jgi:hypothetical protein